VFELYNKGKQTLYYGVDPTADSLHLGNFVGFMHAVQYTKRNNHFVVIVGGATGMIGDPGGKDAERSFLDEETLSKNVQAITKQVETILVHLTELSGYTFSFEVINNLDFYDGVSYIQFLRDIGKHITINQMMAKETVKRRIEDPDASISYTEFSYMLMQGYDFYQLYQDHDCKLQIAGSDQWGNIVTGVELVRKKLDETAYGVTCPLILDSTGKKFGKSEGNALWLDPQKNSPYVVYQYFMNAADEDIERYLKLLTLLDFDEIHTIVTQHTKDTATRYGQTQLAYYVVQTIFGKDEADHAQAITSLFFGEQDRLEQVQAMSKKAIKALNQATG
jgi:tyrosyl-tRNA synthetase